MKKNRRASGDHHLLVRDDHTIALAKSEKQFLVHGDLSHIRAAVRGKNVRVSKLSNVSALLHCSNSSQRDRLMALLRENFVVHHAYLDTKSNALMFLNDRVYIRFESDHPDIPSLVKKYALTHVGVIADVHVFQLTSKTGCNPLKLANKIGKNKEVKSCIPEFLSKQQSSLIREGQWTLSDQLRQGWSNHLFAPGTSSALAKRALGVVTPSSDVVVAVMDDGFDLAHEALSGNVSPNAKDFVNPANKARAGANDFHGTPVAGIAIGNSGEFSGIAPGCRFLPIRIQVALASPSDIFLAIQHASEFADVLNISLEMAPLDSPHGILWPQSGIPDGIKTITSVGGRRRKGLIIVVAAGNSGLPTQMDSQENKARRKAIGFNDVFSPGQSIYTGYPNLPGVIVVSSVTSQNRLATYSNWGREISVAGCSGDLVATDGATVHSTQNDSSGKKLDPHSTNPKYVDNFNGTSAAAPMVAGLAALIISLNPDLEASEVRRIIESTADKNLDTTVNLVRCPNLRQDSANAFDGTFQNGKSLLFGYGRINAYRAVLRALALKETIGGDRKNQAQFKCPIVVPANEKQGICSSVLLSPDDISSISLEIIGSHPNCNALVFTLISPEGFFASLASNAVASNPFSLKFNSANSVAISTMLKNAIGGNGRWILNIQNADTINATTINSISIEVS